jgi:TP901 family phage tail tape measure protein
MAFSALIGALRVALRLDQAEYVEGLQQSKAELKKTAFELNKTAREMSSVGRQFTLGLTVPLAAAAAGAIKTAATFEASMIKVRISTKASAEEMTALETEARKIGKATIFSAGEAADAMDMLAKTGLSTTQILGGAAKAAVDLAAAAGSQLEPAASAISDAMQQFGLSAAQLPGVVDQITGAVNESKLSFEDFTSASGQAGGVAASLGVSFEDFNAVLAGTSSLFSSGSDAGTSFKTFLTTLVPKSEEAAAAIQQFGLKFFEADGSLRSMTAIAEELRTKLAGLSDEAKNQVLKDIFGTDAMRTAIGLMQQGADGLTRLRTEIAKTDAAAQAAERMKGFNGQLEQLKGSLEELAIVVGESGVLGAATQLVTGLTGVIDKVSELDPAIVKVGLGTAAFLAAVGPLNLALGGLAAASATALRAVVGLGAGATTLKVAMTGLVGFLGPGGLMVLGIGAVAAVTLLAVQRFQSLRAASAEVLQQTKSLEGATNAYVAAVEAAAAATGKAREEHLKEAAALRVKYAALRDETAAKLASAKATLAQAEADLARRVNETNPFLVNAEDPNSGLVAQDNRAARAAANVRVQREALAAANKKVADAETKLADSAKAVIPPMAKINATVGEQAEKMSAAAKAAEQLAKTLRDDLAAAQREVEQTNLTQNEVKARELWVKAHEATLAGMNAEAKAFAELAEWWRKGDIAVQQLADSQGELGNTAQDLAKDMAPLANKLSAMEQAAVDLADGFDDVRYSLEGIFHAFGGGLGIAAAGLSAGAFLSGGAAAAAIANGIVGLGGSAALAGGIGAAIAGPIAAALGPIGIAAGAAYALYTLLKGKPSNKGAGFDLTTGQLSGDRRSKETEEAAVAAANAIRSGQSILEKAGITLGATVRGLVIGTRDLSQVYLTNGQTVTSAVGDAAAAAEAGLRAMLETATFTDDTQKNLVQSMLAAGKGFDEIAASLEKLAGAKGLIDAVNSEILRLTDEDAFDKAELEKAQKARRDQFKAAFEEGLLSQADFDTLIAKVSELEGLELKDLLERLGDEVGGVTEATRNFRDEIAREILRFTSPDAFQIDGLKLAQAARRQEVADALAEGLLTAAEFAEIETDLDRLDGLELGDLMKELADDATEAAKRLAQGQADIQREYLETIGDAAALQALQRQQALDALPEELRPLKQALFDVQDAVKARDLAEDKRNEARQAAVAAIATETQRLEGVKSRFEQLADGIAAVRKELTSGSLTGLNPRQAAATTAAALARLRVRAEAGDEAALAELPGAIRAFVAAQGGVAGNRAQLVAAQLTAQRAAAAGERAARAQVSDAERQIGELKEQTSLLTGIKEGQASVADALNGLTLADSAAKAVQEGYLKSIDGYMSQLPGQLRTLEETMAAALAAAPQPDMSAPAYGSIYDTPGGPFGSDVTLRWTGAPMGEQLADALMPALVPIVANTGQTAAILNDATRGGNALYTTPSEEA